ncbi:hypothetical protein MKW92_041305 [Papaver armeniacum]|nr:hypothetical protein MKW92_041305 [Papaver armeniacum]
MKPHAVFIPVPTQGHVTPMMTLAKLFHSKGFHITFVNTEFNHQRLINSRGPDSKKMQLPFRNLIEKLNNNSKSSISSPSSEDIQPPVTCIISDGMMRFALKVGVELGIPVALFWTASACGLICYLHFTQLIERGLVPLKDESDLTNGYLDTKIDWIPGMKDIRLRDLPGFVRTMDTSDIHFDYFVTELAGMNEATALIMNTFDTLEKDVLDALKSDQLSLPPLYTIGPVHELLHHAVTEKTMKNNPASETTSIESNLWKEETECLKWLDSKESNSVVYINFGSIIVMTTQQLIEFAWGLAYSNHPFLWIVRGDIVRGDTATLPPEFIEEIKERGLLAGWCPQEKVLKHPSIGAFLTHSGWNSTLESVNGGVPVLCYPLFAEQHTNCKYSCVDWGIGMQIDHNFTRNVVTKMVKELMEGEKGKEMKHRATEWKQKAEDAVAPGGSSFVNLDKIINELLRTRKPSEIKTGSVA